VQEAWSEIIGPLGPSCGPLLTGAEFGRGSPYTEDGRTIVRDGAVCPADFWTVTD